MKNYSVNGSKGSWFVDDNKSSTLDRRGEGYKTKKEAETACKIWNKGLSYEDTRIELRQAGLI